MTEQEKREKVIKGLDCCGYSRFMDKCQECPYDGKDCFKRLKSDALALLKAQEPRVMTLEEVVNSNYPVYIEGGAASGTWAMMPKILETAIEFVANGVYTLYPAFATDEYGKTWRCWTSRPTNAQRKAVKWSERE